MSSAAISSGVSSTTGATWSTTTGATFTGTAGQIVTSSTKMGGVAFSIEVMFKSTANPSAESNLVFC